MPRNPGLPRPNNTVISKGELLRELKQLDESSEARNRILSMESEFRRHITSHVASLPGEAAKFSKFFTSPFVLMFYAKQKGYHFVSQIEQDILPAKMFSSMETSAGRMVQSVVLPIFNWESVESTMHSSTSVIDARRTDNQVLKVATLKSGPRCLNDEMSKDIADDIVAHAEQWAEQANVGNIEFTYAGLYGTPKQSNKKDWHILRNIVETVGTRFVIQTPQNSWKCAFRLRAIRVDVAVRLGKEWWEYMGGSHALLELLVSLIRACVVPTAEIQTNARYIISDLGQIVSTGCLPENYNVSLLQRSQIEWLFFLARHYCDALSD